MTVTELILGENSKLQWIKTASFIGDDKDKIQELFECFFSSDVRLAKRSSQVLGIITDKNPDMLTPYLSNMVKHLSTNPCDAVKRLTVRAFQFINVPEDVEGDYFEFGIRFLKSAEEPIAVKAFAMTSLRRICEKYPDLTSEVIPLIEILVDEKVSPGIVHRGTQELKNLRRLI